MYISCMVYMRRSENNLEFGSLPRMWKLKESNSGWVASLSPQGAISLAPGLCFYTDLHIGKSRGIVILKADSSSQCATTRKLYNNYIYIYMKGNCNTFNRFPFILNIIHELVLNSLSFK